MTPESLGDLVSSNRRSPDSLGRSYHDPELLSLSLSLCFIQEDKDYN